jgi:hypothetical protein
MGNKQMIGRRGSDPSVPSSPPPSLLPVIFHFEVFRFFFLLQKEEERRFQLQNSVIAKISPMVNPSLTQPGVKSFFRDLLGLDPERTLKTEKNEMKTN